MRSKDLVERLKAQDERAFPGLLELHARGVHAFVVDRLRDRSLHEEAIQSVWLAVLEALPFYEETEEVFHTWLYAIAARACRDFDWGGPSERSGAAIHGAWNALELPYGMDPLEAAALVNALESVLARVPPEEREAFKLGYAERLSCEGIGYLLDLSPEEANARLETCVVRVRQQAARLQGVKGNPRLS